MLEVHRRSLEAFEGLLEGRPRSQAGATAPPPWALAFAGAGCFGEPVLGGEVGLAEVFARVRRARLVAGLRRPRRT